MLHVITPSVIFSFNVICRVFPLVSMCRTEQAVPYCCAFRPWNGEMLLEFHIKAWEEMQTLKITYVKLFFFGMNCSFADCQRLHSNVKMLSYMLINSSKISSNISKAAQAMGMDILKYVCSLLLGVNILIEDSLRG